MNEAASIAADHDSAEPVERFGPVEVTRREISKILRLTGIPALRQLASHLKRHPAVPLSDLCERRGVSMSVVQQAYAEHQRSRMLAFMKKNVPPRRGGPRPPVRIATAEGVTLIRRGGDPIPGDPLLRAARKRLTSITTQTTHTHSTDRRNH